VLTGGLPAWSWALWALLTLHGIASILVVHTRLDARSRARSGRSSPRAGLATVFQWIQMALAGGVALSAGLLMALPILLSAAVSLAELRKLRAPEALGEPLKKVGQRTLAVALAHTGLVILALW